MAFMTLLDNAALLLAVSLLHGLWMGRVPTSRLLAQIISGFLFGIAVWVTMSRAWVIEPGVVFDGRSIVMSLAGMFGGPLAVAITGVAAIVHRGMTGGPGLMTGILIIVSSGAIGVGAHYWRRRHSFLNRMSGLYCFGLLIHLNELLCFLLLPHDIMVKLYQALTVPVMVIYPVATLLLGVLLVNLEQKSAADQALRQSRDKLRRLVDQWDEQRLIQCRMIVEHLPHRVFVKDLNSVYIACNQAYANDIGLDAGQIAGKTDFEFFPRQQAEQYHADDIEICQSGQARVLEESYFIKGQKRWVRTSKVPMYDLDGEMVSLMGVFEDITDRVEAEDEIRRLNQDLERRVQQRTSQLDAANKDLESFAYSVSHDLRAPLRAISGFSQIIASRYRDDLNEEGRHYFDNIVQASDQMGRLIDDLLQLSRLGRKAVCRELVSLTQVFADLHRKFQQHANDNQVHLQIPEQGPDVLSDHTLVTVILTNLIENALVYRQEGSDHEVTLRYEVEGENVTLSVSDNGIGIAPEYQDKIFEMFQRLHGQSEYPGTGIGLAMCRKASQLLGTRIQLESEEGKGSTFFLEIPLFMT